MSLSQPVIIIRSYIIKLVGSIGNGIPQYVQWFLRMVVPMCLTIIRKWFANWLCFEMWIPLVVNYLYIEIIYYWCIFAQINFCARQSTANAIAIVFIMYLDVIVGVVVRFLLQLQQKCDVCWFGNWIPHLSAIKETNVGCITLRICWFTNGQIMDIILIFCDRFQN